MSLRTTIGWHIHRWSPWYDVSTVRGVVFEQHKKCRKCGKKKSHIVV